MRHGSDTVLKENSILNLYNGMTRYKINYINYHGKLGYVIPNVITMDDVKRALILFVFLDVLFNKETIIKNDNGINYSSKLSDDFLNDMFDAMLQVDSNKNVDKLKDGPTFLAVIRNKLAHGDYYIENDDLVFTKETDEIRINIYGFISFYVHLIDVLDARIDGYSYTKSYLENKGSLVVKKPITNDQELNAFLSLLKFKSYNLRRIDNKTLKTEEKLELKKCILGIQELSAMGNNTRELDRILQEDYKSRGYVLNIDNQKIKDEKLIEKIKKIIKIDNEIFCKPPCDCDVKDLVYMYGNDIYKLLIADGLQNGIRLNMLLINELIRDNTVDISTCNPNILELLKLYEAEIHSVITLSRIYSLYCHPFDNIYKKENRYHFCRNDELDFSKLNLSDIKPDVINVACDGLVEAEEKVNKILKHINSLSENIDRLNKNIEGMQKKKDLSDIQKDKLNKFIIEEKNKTERLNKLYELYFEYCIYREAVKKDYKDNYKYFYNRAIIEGIRNAISHGNVTIENGYDAKYINDIILKFTNIYEDKICFQASVSLYNLEGLFEEMNTSVLSDFFDKRENKQKTINC